MPKLFFVSDGVWGVAACFTSAAVAIEVIGIAVIAAVRKLANSSVVRRIANISKRKMARLTTAIVSEIIVSARRTQLRRGGRIKLYLCDFLFAKSRHQQHLREERRSETPSRR